MLSDLIFPLSDYLDIVDICIVCITCSRLYNLLSNGELLGYIANTRHYPNNNLHELHKYSKSDRYLLHTIGKLGNVTLADFWLSNAIGIKQDQLDRWDNNNVHYYLNALLDNKHKDLFTNSICRFDITNIDKLIVKYTRLCNTVKLPICKPDIIVVAAAKYRKYDILDTILSTYDLLTGVSCQTGKCDMNLVLFAIDMGATNFSDTMLIAIKSCNVDLVKLLFDKVDVSEDNYKVLAISTDNQEIINLFGNISCYNKLVGYVMRNDLNLVKQAVRCGANHICATFNRAVDLSIQHGRYEIYDYLTNKCYVPHTQRHLKSAALSGNSKILKDVMLKGDYNGNDYQKALACVIYADCNIDCVKMLVSLSDNIVLVLEQIIENAYVTRDMMHVIDLLLVKVNVGNGLLELLVKHRYFRLCEYVMSKYC